MISIAVIPALVGEVHRLQRYSAPMGYYLHFRDFSCINTPIRQVPRSAQSVILEKPVSVAKVDQNERRFAANRGEAAPKKCAPDTGTQRQWRPNRSPDEKSVLERRSR
jgi:hypothetical protein